MARRKADGTIVDGDRRTACVATPTGRKWVRWTARMKAAFLDELAATCNVLGSARAIGVDAASVYGLRRRDQDFADAWQHALAQGYEMLETQLVGHALAGGAPDRLLANGDPARPPIDVDLALRLLSGHRDKGGRHQRPGGPRPRTATREETNAALMKKLAAVESRLGIVPPPRPGAPAGSDGVPPPPAAER